jgi:hypothetical protein
MTTRIALLLTTFTFLAAAAFAQTPATLAAPAPAPEPDYPAVRVGVLSYLQYDAELQNRDDFNAFDVTRTYLNINAQLSKRVRFRLTPDIRRATDGSLNGSLVFRIKYAFAQFDITPRSNIRLGANQTPWLDFEEAINGYRVQGTMMSEREGVIPGSSDFGATYFTQLPGGYGEIQAGIYNGEGYTVPEVNKYKSAQGRLTVRPFPRASVIRGLRISGFWSEGRYAAGRPRRYGIVMGSFEHTHLVATVQKLAATDRPLTLAIPTDIERSGWSAFVSPRRSPSGLAAIFRYDSFDPDRSIAANSHQRYIAGGAYWFVWPRARVGLVVTNEQVHYDTPVPPTENRLLFQTHIEF